jgi:hypothetical protein
VGGCSARAGFRAAFAARLIVAESSLVGQDGERLNHTLKLVLRSYYTYELRNLRKHTLFLFAMSNRKGVF